MKADQERVIALLTETVTLLCKNGLHYEKELRVQGLLGVTLDAEEVFIVHINEVLKSTGNDGNTGEKKKDQRPTTQDELLLSSGDADQNARRGKRRKRKQMSGHTGRRNASMSESSESDASSPNEDDYKTDATRLVQDSNEGRALDEEEEVNLLPYETLPHIYFKPEPPQDDVDDLDIVIVENDDAGRKRQRSKRNVVSNEPPFGIVSAIERSSLLASSSSFDLQFSDQKISDSSLNVKSELLSADVDTFVEPSNSDSFLITVADQSVLNHRTLGTRCRGGYEPRLSDSTWDANRRMNSNNQQFGSTTLHGADWNAFQPEKNDGFPSNSRLIPGQSSSSSLSSSSFRYKPPNHRHQRSFYRPRSSFGLGLTSSVGHSTSSLVFRSARRPVDSSEKSYACEYDGCEKSYYERKNLLQHQYLKHGRMRILR